MCLDLLPVAHVVFHVGKIDTLLVVDIDMDIFDHFIASEVILSNLDLLKQVGSV